MKRLLIAAILMTIGSAASAQAPSVTGTWLTASGVAQVQVGPCADPAGGALSKGPDGQVVAPDAATDYRNADAKLRSRKVIGMPLIWDFKKTADPNVFEDGHIYNGENGKTYNANISLQPDGPLRLRGYVGSPMFGETQVWTRVKQ